MDDWAPPIDQPAIYEGVVTHARLAPFRHRFAYRVFALWLPIDHLEALSNSSRLFGYRCWRLMQFCDRDHGARDGSALRPWLEKLMHEAGAAMPDGPVMVMCYPRLLGYVFNPLSVFVLYDRARQIRGVVYEVKNTFGEQHCYVMPVPDGHQGLLTQQCRKQFHVSPFLPLAGSYRFRLRLDDDKFSLLIRQFGAGEADGAADNYGAEQMYATFVGQKRSWSEQNLLGVWLRHPLMTFKVIMGIHWEALALWRKGARLFRRTPHNRVMSTGTTD